MEDAKVVNVAVVDPAASEGSSSGKNRGSTNGIGGTEGEGEGSDRGDVFDRNIAAENAGEDESGDADFDEDEEANIDDDSEESDEEDEGFFLSNECEKDDPMEHALEALLDIQAEKEKEVSRHRCKRVREVGDKG
jgi:hypothetical protein